MNKPNAAQKALLITGVIGLTAAYMILKGKSAKTASTSSSGDKSQFTGGYATYNYADGQGDSDICSKLMTALHFVQSMLNSNNLTAAQMTALKNQEMELLAQMQRLGCYSIS